MSELRYVVCMEKKRRIFLLICSAISVLVAIIAIVMSKGKCESVLNYLAVIFVVCFFMWAAVYNICQLKRRVEVYKGKIVYCYCGRKKEYRLSDIYRTETSDESFKVYNDNIGYSRYWDKVTAFYDASGKKLFKFGLGYENVELLVKDVFNTRKSVNRNKRRK